MTSSVWRECDEGRDGGISRQDTEGVWKLGSRVMDIMSACVNVCARGCLCVFKNGEMRLYTSGGHLEKENDMDDWSPGRLYPYQGYGF